MPRRARKNPGRTIVQIGFGLSLAALVFAVIWGLPHYGGGDGRSNTQTIYPPLWALPLFALTAGFGLGVPLGCLWANRMNRAGLLRPTTGRVISTLIMAALMPAGVVGGFPVPLWIVLSRNLFGLKSPETIAQFFLSTPSPALTLIYVSLSLASLALLSFALIYTLPQRWRIPAFMGLWFGAAAALVLAGYGFGFNL